MKPDSLIIALLCLNKQARLGDREERRPSSLDRSSPNKMPLSDLLLAPRHSQLAIPLRPIIYKECEHISSRGQFPQFLLKSAGFGEKEKATLTLLTQVCRLQASNYLEENVVGTLSAWLLAPPYRAVHTSLMRRNGTCQEIRNCCDIHIPSKIIPLQNIL